MQNSNRLILIFSACLFLTNCAEIDTQAQYISATPRSTSNLAVPPGLDAPSFDSSYKLINVTESYRVNQVKDMNINEAGSERWLTVNNKNVDQIWPLMLTYLNNLGLTIKYKNAATGFIQTDWATKNNEVPQTGVRQLFSYIGWGSMYSLPSQYSFRINLWQNNENTEIFVTDYQMNEVYASSKIPNYSTVEPSSDERTKWISLPPNPQTQLDFLINFMVFNGLSESEINQVTLKPQESTTLNFESDQLIINDSFDRTWWRTALALERVGLGITDKDRSEGLYYVYPLKSQIDTPEDPNIFERWFGIGESNTLELPKAIYIIKLADNNTQTIITFNLSKDATDKDFNKNKIKYLKALSDQLNQ